MECSSLKYSEIFPRGKSSDCFYNGDKGIILLCLSQGEGNYPVTASKKGKSWWTVKLKVWWFHTLSRGSGCLKWTLLEHWRFPYTTTTRTENVQLLNCSRNEEALDMKVQKYLRDNSSGKEGIMFLELFVSHITI